MLHMTLRLVAEADFRRGVPTHVAELRRRKMWPDLKANEVVLLISHVGTQLAFCFRPTTITVASRAEPVEGIAHYRLQLDARTPWSPNMLEEYARRAGIVLVGAQRFAAHAGVARMEVAREVKASTPTDSKVKKILPSDPRPKTGGNTSSSVDFGV